MRVPIVCLDERLRQFTATFSSCFSKPQRQYFVIVLMGLMLCWEPRTLSGLLRQVSAEVSLSGTSRRDVRLCQAVTKSSMESGGRASWRLMKTQMV